jgi:hypothetical protein
MYSQSGGATLYERRKRPVERKKHGRSSIWEFKMRTEKIHKAKVIGSPKTDIKIKKIPKKKKNKSCVELYKQAVEEIKDYLITFKSDMVRYSAGDYRYVEVIEEDNLADFPNMFFNYDTMIGGVKTGFIRYGPYYRDSMTEEKACALLEARGKVVARDMKSDPDKPVWTIQSGVIGGGNNMGAVKLKDGNHHHSWFFQFWYGGPHTKSYQTKGELVMIEIMNIVDDILEKYNNMR